MKSETLADVCDLLTDGTHYTPPDIGVGMPFLTVKDVSEQGLDFANCAKISTEEYELAARQNSAPQKGDILFSKDGTVGKVHLVREQQRFAVLSSLAIIRPKKHVDPCYLTWYLRSPTAINSATERKTGSAIRRIVLRDLGNLPVTIPPLDEQRRIAAILDHADALRRKRFATLKILSALPGQLYRLTFEDTRKTRSFEIRRLADLCVSSDDIRCGPFGTQLLREEFEANGVPLWGIKHVNSGFSIATSEFVSQRKAAELSNYDLAPHDLVMTRKGTVGNCALYPAEYPAGVMHSDLLRIRLSNELCNPVFVAEQLKASARITRQIELISGGAIMAGINVGKLKKIDVIVPPKQLQDEFASRLERTSKLKHSATRAAKTLENFFSALQARAFGGGFSSERLADEITKAAAE